MIFQRSPRSETSSDSIHSRLGEYLLYALLALSLIYYVAMVLDLILHPLALGVGYDAYFEERFLTVAAGTGVMVVGTFIMRRVPGNGVGPLLVIYGVGGAGWETRADWGSPPVTSLMHLLLNFYTVGVANVALVLLLLSFPTGHIYPRKALHWIALYLTLFMIGITLVVMAQRPGETVFFEGDLPVNPLLMPALAPYYALISYSVVFLFILGILATVVSLVLRYRAAQIRERQQIKWFVWVTGVVLALTIFSATLLILDPNNVMLGSPPGIAFIIFFGGGLLEFYPVIGIGIAILRHRLWDIDIIINRTLVYGSLTAILAILYFGLIFALQYLLQGIFQQNNDVAIVVSTLAIAALFQPLRHHIQRLIDRRFYRSKYDAARTLATFSATLRNEVDLSHLSEQLIAVVQDTMQPSHVSLWLREPGSKLSRPERMPQR